MQRTYADLYGLFYPRTSYLERKFKNKKNMIYYNPFQNREDDEVKKLPEKDRVKVVLLRALIYLITVALALIISAICSSCATKRTVEEHHHHHYEADTAAVHAQVDSHLQSWRTEMEAAWHAFENQYSAQWTANEREQEVITELITVSTDSVGRTLRTEQRTISRDITRELLQQEQRITREYEARLHAVVDSVNAIWRQAFDSLASHVAQEDSTSYISHPTSTIDNRPWYRRWLDRLKWLVIGAVILPIFFLISKKR